MKNIPSLARILFVVLLLATFTGCSPGGDRRVLTLAIGTAPSRLDPALVVDAAGGELCSQLFQGLVRFSTQGDVIANAAKSWDISPDGRRYTFHLDTRMRFSDGRPVRAGDVQTSFLRVLSPQSRSPRSWVLEPLRGAKRYVSGDASGVDGIVVTNDSTITLELEAAFAPFLSMLAMPAAMIVPEDTPPAAAEGTGVPLGSGPWRLAEWARGDYFSLVPNPHHPFASTELDEIRIRLIPEAFTRVAEFESGALDILEVPKPEIGRFLNDERRQSMLQSNAELRVSYIGLNNNDPRFSNWQVRRALNLAVDVDELIRVLLAGQGLRAAGAIPPGLPGYRDRKPYAYDPVAARRLLAVAGYPEGFEMEIWQRESPEGDRVLEAIQGYLADVGIRVKLVRREWSAFKEAVSQGRVDAFFLDWFADYPNAENFIFPLFHSSNMGGGGNRVFYRNEAVDAMIDSASRTLDADFRASLYAEIDSTIYNDAPWIYLFFPKAFYAISPDVEGYELPTLYLGADYSKVRKRP